VRGGRGGGDETSGGSHGLVQQGLYQSMARGGGSLDVQGGFGVAEGVGWGQQSLT